MTTYGDCCKGGGSGASGRTETGSLTLGDGEAATAAFGAGGGGCCCCCKALKQQKYRIQVTKVCLEPPVVEETVCWLLEG